MNALFREYLLLWLRIRLLWWTAALRQVDPCHPDVPYIMRTQWDIVARIRALEQLRKGNQV